jgi:hypothetical protein
MPEKDAPTPPGVSDDGDATVDQSLIDATLAMTVRQRLQQNDRMIRSILQLRAGFAALKLSALSTEDTGAGDARTR